MRPNGERVRMELDFDKYKAQQCCDNPACQYDGKTGEDNIRTHSRQHQQVYCNACKNIWVITKGTFFYNLKAPVSLVLEVLRLLSEGMGLRAVCRTKGVTPDAVGAWLLKAAKHGDYSKDTGSLQPARVSCKVWRVCWRPSPWASRHMSSAKRALIWACVRTR